MNIYNIFKFIQNVKEKVLRKLDAELEEIKRRAMIYVDREIEGAKKRRACKHKCCCRKRDSSLDR